MFRVDAESSYYGMLSMYGPARCGLIRDSNAVVDVSCVVQQAPTVSYVQYGSMALRASSAQVPTPDRNFLVLTDLEVLQSGLLLLW